MTGDDEGFFIMRYLGSKRRLAKDILPIILRDRQPGQVYVEPFMGGANIFDKVENPRIGSDANPWLMTMWKALQSGWTPPTHIDEVEYKTLRKQARELTHDRVAYLFGLDQCAKIGFVGAGVSFGGKWFGGYCRDAKGTNYAEQSARSVLKQTELLRGAKLLSAPYEGLNPILADHCPAVIYCDPPYTGATGYGSSWGQKAFWEWCEKMAREGHKVFVSEYTAPKGWVSVFEKKQTVPVNAKTGYKKAVEKLWVRGT